MPTENAQDAITNLEARLAFQEDTIDSLNKEVAELSLQLADMRKQMQTLYRKMDNLTYEWEQTNGSENEEKPPHY